MVRGGHFFFSFWVMLEPIDIVIYEPVPTCLQRGKIPSGVCRKLRKESVERHVRDRLYII